MLAAYHGVWVGFKYGGTEDPGRMLYIMDSEGGNDRYSCLQRLV